METQNKNPNNPVIWFEIYVDDLKRARKFYENVLDIELQDLPDPNDSGMELLAFPMQMDRPNCTGSLVKMDGFTAGNNSTIVYFSCEDCSIEEARVPECGGKIHKSKMSIGKHGFMSLCIDTEGNMIGLHSMT